MGVDQENKKIVVNSGLLDSLWDGSPAEESAAPPPAPSPSPAITPLVATPAKDPARAGELHRKAMESYREEAYEEAAGLFLEAGELQPSNWAAHFNRGLCCAGLEAWEDAAEAFDRACSLEPTRWPIHFSLGVSRLRSGHAEAALRAFYKALSLAPGEIQPRLGCAAALHMLGRFRGAAGAYSELLRDHGESEDLLANLALVHAALGEKAQAASYARRLTALAGPGHPVVKALAG